jgi:hypothetical protein
MTEAPRANRARPARPGAVRAVIGLAAAVGAWTAFSWWSSPTVFGPPGNGISTTQSTDQLHELHVPMTEVSVHSPTYELVLKEARARVTANTAEATVGFAVCTPSGEGFVTATGDLSEHCAALSPVREATLTVNGNPDQFVVMSISPTRPGVVRISGMDLTYAHGWQRAWQRGTQPTGYHVRVRVR